MTKLQLLTIFREKDYQVSLWYEDWYEGDILTFNLILVSIMIEHLTKETFLTRVFNYEINKEWKFEGNKPCLIDFYADWCGPCKMLAPVLEELAKDFDGKLEIYKVNTEEEHELASVFGIKSIPSILFVPLTGQPQMAMGALPKETLIKAFKEVLSIEK
jgi:thioredoxin